MVPIEKLVHLGAPYIPSLPSRGLAITGGFHRILCLDHPPDRLILCHRLTCEGAEDFVCAAHRDQLCLARAISALPGMSFSARSTALRGADKVEDSVDRTSLQIEQAVLLTETESAKRVGVSLSTFRRWRRKGNRAEVLLAGRRTPVPNR